VGPGTAGSAAAVLLAWAAWSRWHFAPYWLLVPALLLLWPGIWAADVVAKNLKIEDPGLVVVDEVIGQWITLAGATTLNWKSWLAGFLLFRRRDGRRVRRAGVICGRVVQCLLI
jgi:phosphatidylglycerophosphatase A